MEAVDDSRPNSGLFQSLFKGLSVDDNTETQSYLDVLGEPLRFLRQKENDQRQQLTRLIEIHRDNLSNGKSVNVSRQELLALLDSLAQGHQAMIEIYTTGRTSKIAQMNHFMNMEKNKQALLAKADTLRSQSNEGKSYSVLQAKVNDIDAKISVLEEQLTRLRNQRRLVGQELAQAKSLLDAKTHGYTDTLQELKSREFNEINTLHHRGIVPNVATTASAVTENLKLQAAADEDIIKETTNAQLKLHDSHVYLSHVFETLTKVEKSLGTLMGEDKTPQIITELSDARDVLMDKADQCDRFHMELIKPIINAELDTLIKALQILGVETSVESSFENVSTPEKGRSTSVLPKSRSPSKSPSPIMAPPLPLAKAADSSTVSTTVAKGSIEKQEKKYTDLLSNMKRSKGAKKD